MCFRRTRTSRQRGLAGLNGRADIRRKPVVAETPGRGANPWPTSIVGLGAGARRGHAQLQLPARSRNKTRGGLCRVRLGAAVVMGGTDAVTGTGATASAVYLPASRASPAVAGGCGSREIASGGGVVPDRLFRGAERLCVRIRARRRRGHRAILRPGAGVCWNDAGLGVLCWCLTGWRTLRRLRPCT